MEDVMKKVAKFAIDGSNEEVRLRCRQVSQDIAIIIIIIQVYSGPACHNYHLTDICPVIADLPEVSDGLSTGEETEETS